MTDIYSVYSLNKTVSTSSPSSNFNQAVVYISNSYDLLVCESRGKYPPYSTLKSMSISSLRTLEPQFFICKIMYFFSRENKSSFELAVSTFIGIICLNITH